MKGLSAAFPVLLLTMSLLLRSAPGEATAGLAEWRIKTPGGNLIAHEDPYLEQHATCLMEPGQAGGEPRILVSHLEWWQYHRGHVAGKSRDGYFLFNEAAREIIRFATQKDLTREIRRRRLGDAESKRLEPADGWSLAWAPLFAERCAKLKRNDPEFTSLSRDQREAMLKLCEQVGKK